MKKLLGIIIVGLLLSGCATTVSNDVQDQLIKDNKVVMTSSFLSKPHVIKNIPPGRYRLKYIFDLNNNSKWDSGSWQNKTQPEQVR